MLEEGYAGGGGSVADYQSWWTSLRFDPEFDPGLVFPVFDPRGQTAAVAVCWQSAFVKDLVVAPSHRRRGLASNLLLLVFATFRARGANSVSLKVEADNLRAITLYRSVGMIESAVDN